MGPLMGTNKAAWGVKLLLMTVSAYQGLWQFLCNTEHTTLLFVSLWIVLPAFGFPPTPNTHPTHPPPINFIHDIAGAVKTITKTSSVSYMTELVIKL